MTAFQKIHDAAINRHGAEFVQMRLPVPLNANALKKVTDDRYLSQMSFRIFSAGLRHDMVRKKWPAFEDAFFDFDPARVGFMNEEDLDRLMGDNRLIRHGGKMKATIHNGSAMQDVATEYSGFGNYIANWPNQDLAGLWTDIAKRFKFLGGNSGPYFLRQVGKDTFFLSNDVVRGLEHWCGLEDAAKNKTNIQKSHDIFQNWAAETGRPFSEISMILALST
jgi:3-methyladenine DNA glycosylase Tag